MNSHSCLFCCCCQAGRCFGQSLPVTLLPTSCHWSPAGEKRPADSCSAPALATWTVLAASQPGLPCLVPSLEGSQGWQLGIGHLLKGAWWGQELSEGVGKPRRNLRRQGSGSWDWRPSLFPVQVQGSQCSSSCQAALTGVAWVGFLWSGKEEASPAWTLPLGRPFVPAAVKLTVQVSTQP